jgi:hypothetical protein
MSDPNADFGYEIISYSYNYERNTLKFGDAELPLTENMRLFLESVCADSRYRENIKIQGFVRKTTCETTEKPDG